MKLGAFFFEILPLLAFFAGYQYFGLIAAAALSVGCGALVLTIAWIRERRMAAFPLFSLAMSAAFTAVAWWGGDGFFIKIQPTIFNGLFAAVLLGGWLAGWAMMRVFFVAPVLPDRRYLAAAKLPLGVLLPDPCGGERNCLARLQRGRLGVLQDVHRGTGQLCLHDGAAAADPSWQAALIRGAGR